MRKKDSSYAGAVPCPVVRVDLLGSRRTPLRSCLCRRTSERNAGTTSFLPSSWLKSSTASHGGALTFQWPDLLLVPHKTIAPAQAPDSELQCGGGKEQPGQKSLQSITFAAWGNEWDKEPWGGNVSCWGWSLKSSSSLSAAHLAVILHIKRTKWLLECTEEIIDTWWRGLAGLSRQSDGN